MTKNISVTDQDGRMIGTTYPKRAAGLVKNGRAIYLDDCTIRLSGKREPSDIELFITEGKHMNYLYFNARDWAEKQPETSNQGNGWSQNGFFQGMQGMFQGGHQSTVEKSYINDFDGNLVETIMLGDWDEPCVEVVSKVMGLNAGEQYTFVFWLNGGENDRRDETCKLQISFDTNPAIDNNYKLNRGFIKPLLHKEGWELYAIPFQVPAEMQTIVNTRMSFIAGNAPMAVKAAGNPELYQDWKDEPDEFAALRPQRHNLVFEDGWPSIHMYGGDKYSTEALRKKKGIELTPSQRQALQDVAGNVQQMAQEFAAKSKQVAKELAQSTRQMAEHYKEKFDNRESANAQDGITPEPTSTVEPEESIQQEQPIQPEQPITPMNEEGGNESAQAGETAWNGGEAGTGDSQ